MISKKIVAAVGAGAIAGAAGIALAGGSSVASAATTTGSAHKAGVHHHHKGKLGTLARMEHGTAVIQTKKGSETVELARGTVSAVSATAVTITSADKTATTFTIVPGSTFRLDGKKVAASAIKVGDKARGLAVETGGVFNLKGLQARDAAAPTHAKKARGATA